jgi:small subunit ribosomal protein S19
MSRAKWKGPFISNQLIQSCKINKISKYKKEIVTTSRASSIIPCFVGLSLNVHNGKNFSKINITENMIGKKLGEFVPTRSKFSFKKKKLK